ncbi:MAG: tetratricopeptide repeat protein [Cyanobacteria bacterium P01_E01_bin.45]
MSKELFKRIVKADENSETILKIVLIKKYLEKNPDGTARIWAMYARSLIGMGRYEDASSALERAEKMAFENQIQWIVSQRGTLELRRGNIEAAKSYWMSAHQINPKEASYLIFAASAECQLGHLQQAEALARRATKCTDGCVDEAWYNLGGYLAAQEQYEEALECYRKATSIDPEYEIALKRRDEILAAFPDLAQNDDLT